MSSYVSQYLSVIKKAETYRKAQEWKKKIDLINEIRNNKCDIERVCITCPDVDLPVVTEHPIFEGGLCSSCKADREFMDKNTDDEYKTNLCCICVRPGDIVICCTCPKGYCESCLRLLVGPKEYRKVERLDPWVCYLHNEEDDDNDSTCLIRKRENWEENNTVIADATCKGHVDIVDAVLRNGGQKNITCKEYQATHIAAWWGHLNILVKLKEFECVLNAVSDVSQNTPLYLATKHNHANIVKWLILSGANPYACNRKGKTPIQLALEKGLPELASFMTRAGTSSCLQLHPYIYIVRIAYS